MYRGPTDRGDIWRETPPAEDPTKEKTADDFLALSAFDPNGVLTAHRTVRYNLDYAGNRTSVNDSGPGGFACMRRTKIHEYDQVGNDVLDNGSNHELTSYKGNVYTYKDERLTNVTLEHQWLRPRIRCAWALRETRPAYSAG